MADLEKVFGVCLVPAMKRAKVRALVPYRLPALAGIHGRCCWTNVEGTREMLKKLLEGADGHNEKRTTAERTWGWGWRGWTQIVLPEKPEEKEEKCQQADHIRGMPTRRRVKEK